MKTYILVTWPYSQKFMDYDWFDEEAILEHECREGSSAYFIPINRYEEVILQENIN